MLPVFQRVLVALEFKVKIIELPIQMIVLELMVNVGVAITLTVVTAIFVQELSVPVTVYVSLELGLAVTMLPVALLKLVNEFQVYDDAPLAVKVADVPDP